MFVMSLPYVCDVIAMFVTSLDMFVMSLQNVCDVIVICFGLHFDMFGMSLRYVWDVIAICLGCHCDMFGTSMSPQHLVIAIFFNYNFYKLFYIYSYAVSFISCCCTVGIIYDTYGTCWLRMLVVKKI